RDYFDDTLHNVVRFLLSRWPGLVDRLALKRWEHLQHLSDPGPMPVDPRLVELVDRTIRDGFQAEYFRFDGHSVAYARFEKFLTKSGLLDRFQAKTARGGPVRPPPLRRSVHYAQGADAEPSRRLPARRVALPPPRVQRGGGDALPRLP